MTLDLSEDEETLLRDVLEDVMDCNCGKAACKRDKVTAGPILEKLNAEV